MVLELLFLTPMHSIYNYNEFSINFEKLDKLIENVTEKDSNLGFLLENCLREKESERLDLI